MTHDELVINYEVYEDGTEYVGTSSASLPSLTSINTVIAGAGIAGNVGVSVIGHFDVMTLILNFRTFTEAATGLAEPRIHQLELWSAQQLEDPGKGEIIVQSVKHVMRVMPKVLNAGNLAPASPADASGEYDVRYWGVYVDEKKRYEIDPFNCVAYIKDKDYLAHVRKALGKY